ncbi:MAG: hypothetical protein K2O40_04885 [Lachnospiraceae bacterium]|nr:hypothetical protein [Lachnospiraceae bacterium]
METVIIHFSDKSTLSLNEGDFLIPILRIDKDNQIFASLDQPAELWNHIQNGLIPSILDVFVKCDFFYLKNDPNTVYNSKAIVKIEII